MAKAKLLEERVGRARLPNGLMVFPENVVVDSPFIVPTPEKARRAGRLHVTSVVNGGTFEVTARRAHRPNVTRDTKSGGGSGSASSRAGASPHQSLTACYPQHSFKLLGRNRHD